MKQLISRDPSARPSDTDAVYVQEGAPLTDALWNEAVDTASSGLRSVILDSGLHGTAGAELRVEPILDPNLGLDLVLKGGPGRFYCDGLCVVWPADLHLSEQSCACDARPLREVLAADPTAPVFVWLEARAVFLDEHDLPALRDPAVQSERGSFRRAIRACVHVAAVHDVPGALVPKLTAIEGVAPYLAGKLLKVPPPATDVRLTVQGAYASEENLHYLVELIAKRTQLDTYTYGVELLWDDRAASVVTRLASDAAEQALEIEVQSSEGFEPGHFIRLEGDGVDDQIYEITRVDDYRLGIRRRLCDPVHSLAELAIVAAQVSGDPNKPASLNITLMLNGANELAVGDLVTDLSRGPDAATLPFFDHPWKIVEIGGDGGKDESILTLVPHFGLTAALSPWGEPLALMKHARIHEHCVVVENKACWKPGTRIRISGRPRARAAGDPCWRPEDIDADHECWPAREPLFRDEDRTITWIERCGEAVVCCDTRHTTMTLRLDVPLAADHSKCCDEVRPARDIKVRRYAGHACEARLQALWPCCDDTGGVCCLVPSLTLPSGLEVVLTYRGGGGSHFTRGDTWSFAARAGGWYETRVFAPPQAALVGLAPLAMILRDHDKQPPEQYFDLRAIPAAHDQTALLAEIAQSSEELATYTNGVTRQRLTQVKALALFPRLQTNLLKGTSWQRGLVELLYSVAHDFILAHEGKKQSPLPALLLKNPVLAVAFRALAVATQKTRHAPSLSDRELATVARALGRAASTAAAILGGCCGDIGDPDALTWPTLDHLAKPGPLAPKPAPALPKCPDDSKPDTPRPAPHDGPGDIAEDPDDPPPPPPHHGGPGDIAEDPDDPPPPPPHHGGPGDIAEEPDDPPPPPPPHGGPGDIVEDPDGPPPPPPLGGPGGIAGNDVPGDDPPPPSPQPGDLSGGGPGGEPPPPLGGAGDLSGGTPGSDPLPPPPPGDIRIVLARFGAGDLRVNDATIGDFTEDLADAIDPPALSDLAISDLNGPDSDETELPGVVHHVDVMALSTEHLRVVARLNANTTHKIVTDWPTLAHVFKARSDGAARKRVIAAVRRFVAELRAALATDGRPAAAADARVRETWKRHLQDAVPPPPAALIAPTLPSTDEED